MNHLGVVFGDAFGFLVRFLEKGTKSANMGNFRGPTPRRRDTTQQHRSTLRRGMSMPRHG